MNKKLIILTLAATVLCACGTKKHAVSSSSAQPEAPAWHTCLIQGAHATIMLGEEKISANTTMQVVRDSMLVISIMPIAGMELIRLEATPTEIIGISKIGNIYATATYEDINRSIVPKITWKTLQQLCSAELPTDSNEAKIIYTLDTQTIEMSIVYPARKTDVPVRVYHLRTDKYKKVDIREWL